MVVLLLVVVVAVAVAGAGVVVRWLRVEVIRLYQWSCLLFVC